MQYAFKLNILFLLLSFSITQPVLAQTPNFDYYNYLLDAPGPNEDIKTATGELIYSYESHYQIYDNKIVRFVEDDMAEHPEAANDGEYTLTTNNGSKIKIKVVNNDIIDFQLLSDPVQFQATETKIDEQDYCHKAGFLVFSYNSTKKHTQQLLATYETTTQNPNYPGQQHHAHMIFYFQPNGDILVARQYLETEPYDSSRKGEFIYTQSSAAPMTKGYTWQNLSSTTLNEFPATQPLEQEIILRIQDCRVIDYNPDIITLQKTLLP